jgi:hypothetical protein
MRGVLLQQQFHLDAAAAPALSLLFATHVSWTGKPVVTKATLLPASTFKEVARLRALT